MHSQPQDHFKAARLNHNAILKWRVMSTCFGDCTMRQVIARAFSLLFINAHPLLILVLLLHGFF